MIVKRLDKPSTMERAKEPLELLLSLTRRQRMLLLPPWEGFGEPFNGQSARTRTVDRLLGEFSPGAVIETGTFLGFTTRWLAAHDIDTYTVEVSTRFRYAARFALRDLENVTMIWGDSAVAMRHLAADRKIKRPFAYLDAHWEEKVPLNEELDCLFLSWDDVLVAVDDFHVPEEPGYGYDIYGGVPLSLEQIALPADVVVAYPAVAAIEETGSRRGAVFLSNGASGRRALEIAEREGLVRIRHGG